MYYFINNSRFVSEYFAEPERGYGGSVGAVFRKLEQSDCSGPFGPAADQFDGQGSYGNGGAMRISPAALYGYNLDEDDLSVRSTTGFLLSDICFCVTNVLNKTKPFL